MAAYPLKRERWNPTAATASASEPAQHKKTKMADPADEGRATA
jgi:hypothetical protein